MGSVFRSTDFGWQGTNSYRKVIPKSVVAHRKTFVPLPLLDSAGGSPFRHGSWQNKNNLVGSLLCCHQKFCRFSKIQRNATQVYLPPYPKMDDPNSWSIQSPTEITLPSLVC